MNVVVADLDLRYPIGEFDPSVIGSGNRAQHIKTYSELPENLAAAVDGLNDKQLDTPYRPGGWTLRQTVHHLADSHINGLVRVKLALTEDGPTIRPYMEDLWAELPDKSMPIESSIKILQGVHARITHILESLTDEQFARTFNHPETGEWTLDGFIALYAWHSRHHTAHITSLRTRNGW